VGLVHKLTQPSLGFDGDDDDLSAMEILEMKYKECQLYVNSYINEKNHEWLHVKL